MSVVTVTLVRMVIAVVLMLLLGLASARCWACSGRARGRRTSRAVVDAGVDQAEVMQGLDRLSDQMRDLDHQRATWQGQLSQQVLDMRLTTDTLRRETQTLSTALRKPQVRGRWGELHLRRAVELAGLVDRCDFTEQAHTVTSDDARAAARPGGPPGRRAAASWSTPRCRSTPSSTPPAPTTTTQREAHLARHARQLRQPRRRARRPSATGARSRARRSSWCCSCRPSRSWRRPSSADRDLLEDAAARQVVLATPTTLIALLRTVAHGWSHEALADQAREIHRLGRELHERLATLTAHLDQVGRSLNAAVGHYNAAVGSLESRVLVSARRFGDLAVTDDDLPAPAARCVRRWPGAPPRDEPAEPPSVAL